MGTLDGKVALVTGAGRGIGRAIAVELARRGAKTFALDVAIPESIEVGLWYKACDVTDVEWVKSTIDTIAQEFGGIDILVNNAGISPACTVRKLTPDHIRQVLDVDLIGPMYLTALVAQQMIRQNEGFPEGRGFGRIINIASVIGLEGGFGLAAYAAAKAGLIGFTRTTAMELAKYGITCNAVAPGFCEPATTMTRDTDVEHLERIRQMTPDGRLGKPEDIAEAVAFLCSPGAGHINGTVLTVDGGAATGYVPRFPLAHPEVSK